MHCHSSINCNRRHQLLSDMYTLLMLSQCEHYRLEDEEGLVLTPFEKNLEVWRQLWRVLERSDIVVQASTLHSPPHPTPSQHTVPTCNAQRVCNLACGNLPA